MNILIVFGVFVLMEPLTWTIHKYIMHGFLWRLHKDHHDHSSDSTFEKNDYFFVIFALPAIVLFYIGANNSYNHWFYIALGITLYGMAYFFVHDIFIHQRLKVFRNTKNPYFKAIRRAHKQHHKYITKHKGECFGFLFVPIKYFKMYFNKVNR